jgi:hypothetical protein
MGEKCERRKKGEDLRNLRNTEDEKFREARKKLGPISCSHTTGHLPQEKAQDVWSCRSQTSSAGQEPQMNTQALQGDLRHSLVKGRQSLVKGTPSPGSVNMYRNSTQGPICLHKKQEINFFKCVSHNFKILGTKTFKISF